MSDKSKIEWTDATWNPTTGCTKISPGCANCYIERTPPFRIKGRKFVNGHIPLEFHPDRLDKPLHWREPRMVFVNSLSDLFHEDVPYEFISSVFEVMSKAERHTFQVLTKRADRMADFCKYKAPLPNVWLGVTAENQATADARIPWLLNTPAAVRFVSYEPALGPVDFSRCMCPTHWHWDANFKTPEEAKAAGAYAERKRQALVSANSVFIDWLICGGESGDGPNIRPMQPDWARSARDQCQAAAVPFFFKQWGEWFPIDINGDLRPFSKNEIEFGFARWGKKAAGRVLDGREWNEMPKVAAEVSR